MSGPVFASPILDDFNRADGALGGDWIDGSPSLVIASNQVAASQAGYCGATYDTTLNAQAEIFVTLAALGGDQEHLELVLLDAGGSGYLLELRIEASGGDRMRLYRADAGVWSLISSDVLSEDFAPGDRLALVVSETAVHIWRDSGSGWVEIYNVEDTTHRGTFIPGVNLENTTWRIDDFGAGDGTAPPPPATVVPTSNQLVTPARVAIGSENAQEWPDPAATAERCGIVILQSWQTDRARQLKAANPNCRVLMYKNLAGCSHSEHTATGRFTSGVSYDEADANGWLETDGNGDPIQFPFHSFLWLGQLDNPDYLAAWASNVIGECEADNGEAPTWDGVFLDNTDVNMNGVGAGDSPKYPSDAVWQETMRGAIAAVCSALANANLVAILNIGAWHEDPDPGRTYLRQPGVAGACNEHFVGHSGSKNLIGNMIRNAAYAASIGRYFLGITTGPDPSLDTAIWGMAAAFMAAPSDPGLMHWCLHNTPGQAPGYTDERVFATLERVDLGVPVGEAEDGGSNGFWEREFTKGYAAINSLTNAADATAQITGLHRSVTGSIFSAQPILNPGEAIIAQQARLMVRRGGAWVEAPGYMRVGESWEQFAEGVV